MAFASFDSKNAGAPMSEINMVPLIDVIVPWATVRSPA